jgi:TANK-binding kinase 1
LILFRGLKLLITPLLAGLMECDINLMWSFEQFFEEVEAILRKKIVVVFSMVSVNEIHVFVEPNAG